MFYEIALGRLEVLYCHSRIILKTIFSSEFKMNGSVLIPLKLSRTTVITLTSRVEQHVKSRQNDDIFLWFLFRQTDIGRVIEDNALKSRLNSVFVRK